MGTNIGRVDIAHCVSRNAGCRSARPHRTEVARIRDESEQRAINGITDHDAALFTRLHLRRSVASGRLVAQRDADINLVIRANEDRAWLAKLMPGRDEFAVLIENLDTTVATIGNVDASHRTADRDIVRVIEIARHRSFVTPGLDEPAILGELEDAGIVRGAASY